MQVGNMADINRMTMLDFVRLNRHIERQQKIHSGDKVPLKESQKKLMEDMKKRLEDG